MVLQCPFLNDKRLKVNSKTYKNLEKELLPETGGIMKRNHWIFIKDSAPSHRSNLIQDFFNGKNSQRFVKQNE